MTITITKLGELPEKKLYTGECSNCKTKVEFQREDASHYSYDLHDGETIMVGCPLCGRDILGQSKK